MARGSKAAQAGADFGVGNAKTLGGNAQGLYSTLAPSLTSEALAPPGMSEKDLAAINTAGQQSEGGSMAGAVGQGGLLAARTRNAGGADAAIADAARGGGERTSEGALKTQIMNAQLKQQQRRAALGQMGDLYGTGVSGTSANLGATASNVNADAAAKEASWGWTKGLSAIAGAASPFLPGKR
jgi:hypothetical protein